MAFRFDSRKFEPVRMPASTTKLSKGRVIGSLNKVGAAVADGAFGQVVACREVAHQDGLHALVAQVLQELAEARGRASAAPRSGGGRCAG